MRLEEEDIYLFLFLKFFGWHHFLRLFGDCVIIFGLLLFGLSEHSIFLKLIDDLSVVHLEFIYFFLFVESFLVVDGQVVVQFVKVLSGVDWSSLGTVYA